MKSLHILTRILRQQISEKNLHLKQHRIALHSIEKKIEHDQKILHAAEKEPDNPNLHRFSDLKTFFCKQISTSIATSEHHKTVIQNGIKHLQHNIQKDFYKKKTFDIMCDRFKLNKQRAIQKKSMCDIDELTQRQYILDGQKKHDNTGI